MLCCCWWQWRILLLIDSPGQLSYPLSTIRYKSGLRHCVHVFKNGYSRCAYTFRRNVCAWVFVYVFINLFNIHTHLPEHPHIRVRCICTPDHTSCESLDDVRRASSSRTGDCYITLCNSIKLCVRVCECLPTVWKTDRQLSGKCQKGSR